MVVHGVRTSKLRIQQVDRQREERTEVNRSVTRLRRRERELVGFGNPRVASDVGEGVCKARRSAYISRTAAAQRERRRTQELQKEFFFTAVIVQAEAASD